MREYKVVLLSLGGGVAGAVGVVLVFLAVWNNSGNLPQTLTPVTNTRATVVQNGVFNEASPSASPASAAVVASPAMVVARSEASTTLEPTLSPTMTSTPSPSPTPETLWTKALVPAAGFTVMFPSDWVLDPASSKLPQTQIFSWTPVGPAGIDGVPRGGLLIQISVTHDPFPTNGQEVKVGDKRYAGIMTTGDLSDPDPFWDPMLIRRVYYEAEGANWLIQGIFGDEVSDANPNLAIFLRIVQSISHVDSPTIPTPTTTPSPMPTPSQPHLDVTFDSVGDYLRASNYVCTDDGNGITQSNGNFSETLKCTSSGFNGFFLAAITGSNLTTVKNVLIMTFASMTGESVADTASRIFQSSLFCFLPHYILADAGQWITTHIGDRAQATFSDVPLTLSDNPEAPGASWLFMAGWP